MARGQQSDALVPVERLEPLSVVSPVSKLTALLRGNRPSSSALVPVVATPTRSLLGMLAASRSRYETASQYPASSGASAQIVVHTAPSALPGGPVGSVSALFARMQSMGESIKGPSSASRQVSSPPALHSLKHSAAGTLVLATQSPRSHFRAAARKRALFQKRQKRSVAAVSSGMIPSRAVTKRVAAKGIQGRRQAKRLRQELQAQSFGPGHDFLQEVASGTRTNAATTAPGVSAQAARAQGASPRSLSASPGSSGPLVMSPTGLAFLESLHTGLTPPQDTTATPSANAETGSDVARCLFGCSPPQAGKPGRGTGRGPKTDTGRNGLMPVGLEEFMCEAKARRHQLSTTLSTLPPSTARRSKGSGAIAVSELRQALRSIDAAAPLPGMRASQVAESDEEEGYDDEEEVPIALIPHFDSSLPADSGFV